MKTSVGKLFALITAVAATISMSVPASAAVTPRIYYGDIVSSPNPYPWMAALLNPARSNGYDAQFCGGSLMASDVIITAAHCVEGITAADVEIAVDVLNLSTISSGQRQAVEEIIIHPDWNTNTTENDIALLILEDGSVNAGITPISLVADGTVLSTGTDVRALGWGELENGTYPELLRTVDLDIASDPGAACGSYGGDYDPVSMLCATRNSEGTIKDTCSGDSGGPLFTIEGGNYRLVGLTSWGNACGLANYPGIYTRLTSYLDWIESETTQTLAFANFTPRSGAPGATVAILGEALDTVTAVSFNGASASFSIVNSGRIEAVVPVAATSGQITITDGVTSLSHGTSFTVVYPTPKPSRVTPSSGVFGISVTIAGKGFLGATSVRFGGVSASSFTVNSDTSITAVVPEGAASGNITVTNPSKSGSGAKFTVTVPAGYPTVTKFSKSSASPGETITLTGTNLSSTTAISFNGTAASTFSVISSTSVSVVVPVGATSGPILVTNGVGTNSSAKTFNVNYPSPSIRSFSPGSASIGDTVTITGKNFSGATIVRFNGVNATSFTVVSATQITAVVPAGATSGKITVANPGKSTTSRGTLSIIG